MRKQPHAEINEDSARCNFSKIGSSARHFQTAGVWGWFFKKNLHPKVVSEYIPPLKQVLQMIIRFTKNVKLVLTELLLSVILRIPCRHQPLKIQAMLHSSSFLTDIFKGYLEYVDEDCFGSWQKFCSQFYLKFYCFIKG